MNQLIWMNKHIKINGRSVFWKQFFEVGIVKIEDLFDDDKNIKAFKFWKNKGLHEKYFLSWYSLVRIILSIQENIKINGRSVFWKQFFEVGIVKIEDLFDDDKNIKAFKFWKNKGLHEK